MDRASAVRGQEAINQRTFMYICITHGQPGESLEWGGGWVERDKKEKVEDICNTVNSEIKFFKKEYTVVGTLAEKRKSIWKVFYYYRQEIC